MIKETELLDEFISYASGNTAGQMVAMDSIAELIAKRGYTKEIDLAADFFLENDNSESGVLCRKADIKWLMLQINKLHDKEEKIAIIPEEKTVSLTNTLLQNKSVRESLEVVAGKEDKQEIILKFGNCFQKIEEWKIKAESITITDIKQTKLMKEAGTARKALVKVRTGAKEMITENKKTLKAKSTAYTKIFEEVERLIKPIEETLKAKEDFKKTFEIEAAKKDLAAKMELRSDRAKLLAPYSAGQDFSQYNLGEIDELVFTMILDGAKAKHELKVKEDAEKVIEEKAKEKVTEIKNNGGIVQFNQIKEKHVPQFIGDYKPEYKKPEIVKNETVKETPKIDPEKANMLQFASDLKLIELPPVTSEKAIKLVSKVMAHIESLAEGIEAVYSV